MNNRIERLRNQIGDQEAVFISSYPNIFYYSGFTSEDADLLISHDKAVLITDSRYTVQAKQQAPEFELADITEGLEHIFDLVPAAYIGYEEHNITVARLEKLQTAAKNKEFIKRQEQISSLREKKDRYEIIKIREAERLGDEAFSHILDFIAVGKTEIEIALELEFFMRRHGASKLSFETIAASGVRSSMPHGTASDKAIAYGDFLTLDFGCVFEGYCSDMTRTVAVGTVSQKQREVYHIVLCAQLAALEQIRIGAKCSDIDQTARNYIKNAGYGPYFGHGLGHSVGIEIHEKPSLSPRCDTIIENGHILTVEPGIYIDGFGGVRIEDLIAVYDDKIENLTNSPKELIIV